MEQFPPTAADAAATSRAESSLTLREFADAAGVVWSVRETLPTARGALPQEYARGWLTFEDSLGQVRRLAPPPSGWRAFADAELAQLCLAATPARQRDDTPTAAMRRLDAAPSAARPDPDAR